MPKHHVPPLHTTKHLRGSVAQSLLSFTHKQGCPALNNIIQAFTCLAWGFCNMHYSSLLLFFTSKESCLICELDSCCVRLGHSPWCRCSSARPSQCSESVS